MRILIVCTGNTCRSPMAHGIISHLLGKLNTADGYEIVSCGISAFDGDPASDHAIAALNEIDIDIKDHRSQRITLDMIEMADVIYVMTEHHKQTILSCYPTDISDKVKVLDVTDPYGGDLAVYCKSRDQLLAFFTDEVKRITNAD